MIPVLLFIGPNKLLGQKKYFTEQSLVQTKKGEIFIGNILINGQEQLTLATDHTDSLSILHKSIRKLYPYDQKILIRNDGKYSFINYAGINIRQIYSGVARQFLIEAGVSFLDDFYLSFIAGDHQEYTDFGVYGMVGYSMRYYLPSQAQRPYAQVAYIYSVANTEDFDNDDTIRVLNLGVGMDLLSRKKVKFEFGTGSHLRRRYTRDLTVDQAGNPVEFERNTLAISWYMEFGLKFRITSFDW